MKKALIAISVSILTISTGAIVLFAKALDRLDKNVITSGYYTLDNRDSYGKKNKPADEYKYSVFSDSEYIGGFNDLDEAIEVAKTHKCAVVKQAGMTNSVWDNLPAYQVFLGDKSYHEFNSFTDALSFAKSKEKANVYYRKGNSLIWDSFDEKPASHKIESVEKIDQNPELPRGCEVTALAMLLNHINIDVSKMDLADEIRKDVTPYSVIDGKVRFGNPHYGFVGSMTSKTENGFGVYNEPIFDLLEKYAPDTAINMTGADFEDLKFFINRNIPVWVIVNVTYSRLPDSEFVTWTTSYGSINITYKEHSVLVTGYDENYVYFNDPMMAKNSAGYKAFVECWEQMGRQAVTVVPKF